MKDSERARISWNDFIFFYDNFKIHVYNAFFIIKYSFEDIVLICSHTLYDKKGQVL